MHAKVGIILKIVVQFCVLLDIKVTYVINVKLPKTTNTKEWQTMFVRNVQILF